MNNARPEEFDVIVLGAGAAGMLCAMTAGSRGRRVLLLDHANEVGRKIQISGGGRCNFTNLHVSADNFISGNPHFCKSALARYTQHDFISLIDKHGILWHEKTQGQLFCDGSAREVVQMLLDECGASAVDIRTAQRITDVSKADRFRVTTDKGYFFAQSVVMATGGLSIPKMGATGFAHDLARRFDLVLSKTRPGLVPLTFEGESLKLMQPLSGVSLECIASLDRAEFREAILFTHRGLSGPSILQISSYWQDGDYISIDLFPGMCATKWLTEQRKKRPRSEGRTVLSDVLPTRLAAALAAAYLPDRPLAEQTNQSLTDLGSLLNRWRLRPSGSEGYAKAEVTLGGIDTRSLSSQTMEAKSVPGLYAIGEAVDVTGWLGGYNFQWAWSSGHAAGQAV